MRFLNTCVLCSLLLLILGGMTYLLYRSKSILLVSWCLNLDFLGTLTKLRFLTFTWGIPEFIKFNLPDAIWSTAYILLINGIKVNYKKRILFSSIIPCLGAFSELLQKTGIIKGTYDILDIFCYVVPLIFFLIFLCIKYITTSRNGII